MNDDNNVIQNGFIGSLVRFIPLRQIDYIYKGNLIKKPKHLIWKDAHNKHLSYIAKLWI